MDCKGLKEINLPEQGKFYRLKNGASGWYATSDLRTGEAQHANKFYMSENGTQANTIWYVGANNALLSYKKGQYLGDMSSDWSFEAIGSEGNTTTFVQGATVGKIQIKPSSGRSLYGDNIRVDAAGEGNNSGNYEWVIEEVTSLPVAVSAAGYATLYAPVALTLPAELTAYTVSVSGDWATLEQIEGNVIPANTGVVLEGAEGSYNLTVGGDAEEIEGNSLLGSVAASYVTDNAYVLGYVNEEVGFYTAKMTEGKWLNNGFKAYLPKSVNGARFISFDFGTETAIDELKGENGNVKTVIYDLAGRRVQGAQKGIFIVNGKRVIK